MGFLESGGGDIIGGALGAVGNMASTAIANKGAKENAQLQYELNEQAADNADARTRALYHDLYSATAQMQQAKEAGLSPSIYANGGMAGKSGVSGAQGSGAGNIPYYGADPMQGAMLGAQIAKTIAETQKTKEETKNLTKTSGLIDAQIIKTYADAKLSTAQQALTQVQTQTEQARANIATATEAVQIQGVIDNMTRAFYESVTAQHEAERRGLLYKKESALFQTEINKSIAEYENLLIDLSVKTANINLTNAQAKSLIEHVAIDWYNAGTNRQNAHTQYESLQAQVEQWAQQNQINLQELDRKKKEMWIDGACRVIGTLGNVACAALGANSINNNQTTYVETTEDVYDKQGNFKGIKHRNQKTYRK